MTDNTITDNTGRSHQISRRVLDAVGADDEIMGVQLHVSLEDLKLFVPIGFIAVLTFLIISSLTTDLGQYAIIGPIIGGIIAVVLLLVTAAIIYIAPRNLQAPHKWLVSIAQYYRAPETMTVFSNDPHQNSASLTNVGKIRAESAAIQRADDRSLVAGVSVTPANMALATDSEWNSMANNFRDTLDAIEFPLQIHSSSRAIDPERIAGVYTDRLTDPDVQAIPALQEVVETYRDELPREFEQRGTSIRQYQILVEVSELDVQLDSHGRLSKLADLPGIGMFLSEILGVTSGMSAADIEREQVQELRERLLTVRRAINSLDGCSASILTADELADLVEEHWSGERTHYADTDATTDRRFNEFPVVTVGSAEQRP
ncbi:hypothetical protein [Haladaptatus sp. CMAA 1911]|uniref:hypothetical protein n=1 Tax=unclassified Haladaptatus TaxID=2622732 RepID=UPI0037550253